MLAFQWPKLSPMKLVEEKEILSITNSMSVLDIRWNYLEKSLLTLCLCYIPRASVPLIDVGCRLGHDKSLLISPLQSVRNLSGFHGRG